MRSWSLLGSAALAASLALVPFAPDVSAGADSGKKVTFLTRNLYLGADLAPAIEAILEFDGDFTPILVAVGQTWANVHATDFPTRARALADEIVDGKPDLVGLQEAALWRTGDFDPSSPAEDVVYDFVAILLDELADRGHPYEVVVVSDGFDVEFPGFVSAEYDIADIRLTERDVILARKGGAVKLSNATAGHFSWNVEFETDLGSVVVQRGWASVDCRSGNEEFRFVTTHLDNDVEVIREFQSHEILDGPCDTNLRVVLVGDMNSDGNGGSTEAAYLNFLDAGFSDSWATLYPDDEGLTWGHDALLADPEPFQAEGTLERIDFVLFRGSGLSAYASDRLGEDPDDRIDGLWPSDHVGVLSTLRIR